MKLVKEHQPLEIKTIILSSLLLGQISHLQILLLDVHTKDLFLMSVAHHAFYRNMKTI